MANGTNRVDSSR